MGWLCACLPLGKQCILKCPSPTGASMSAADPMMESVVAPLPGKINGAAC
jgi:hypothetical protein